MSNHILFLGPSKSPLIEWLESQGEHVHSTMDPLDMDVVTRMLPDFLISYGYRHIIKRDIISKYEGRAINLHVGYLPWNRGADPNLWSFAEGTPKGVTIHYLDEGIDTGDIIAQRLVAPSPDDTLRTSYNRLQAEIQSLFKELWGAILVGECPRFRQKGKGTYHKSADKVQLAHLLTLGWDTPVSVLDDYAGDVQMASQFFEEYYRETRQLKLGVDKP